MRIQPLHSNLIIRPRANSDVSRGGIAIPGIAKASYPFRFGEVLEVGTGRVNAEGKVIPLNVKAGDIVCYAKGAGTEIPLETDTSSEIVVLLGEQYVLGIVHDLPQQTLIQGLDGRLLAMAPTSRAMPDSAAKMREEAEIAVRSGFATEDEIGDDEPNGLTG